MGSLSPLTPIPSSPCKPGGEGRSPTSIVRSNVPHSIARSRIEFKKPRPRQHNQPPSLRQPLRLIDEQRRHQLRIDGHIEVPRDRPQPNDAGNRPRMRNRESDQEPVRRREHRRQRLEPQPLEQLEEIVRIRGSGNSSVVADAAESAGRRAYATFMRCLPSLRAGAQPPSSAPLPACSAMDARCRDRAECRPASRRSRNRRVRRKRTTTRFLLSSNSSLVRVCRSRNRLSRKAATTDQALAEAAELIVTDWINSALGRVHRLWSPRRRTRADAPDSRRSRPQSVADFRTSECTVKSPLQSTRCQE